jgi:DNA-binding transcriptional LysR family regulator
MGAGMQWDDRIGRRLRLRDLHIFMTVVELGSMGRAAKHLAVSQPVVSKAISDLESTLKVRLLDRTARGVEPTLYGSALLSGGTVIFDDLRSSVERIQFLADPTAGKVRIAGFDTMNAGFIPAVIHRLTRKLPHVVFSIFQALDSEGLYAMVRERIIDLVVLHLLTAPIADEALNIELLFPDSLVVVAAVDSKWVRRRKVTLADIVNEPWGLPMKGTSSRAAIASAFHQKGLDMPKRIVNSNSILLHQTMALTGGALTFASRMRLRLSGHRSDLRPVPVDMDIPYGNVSIVTLKNRTLNPAVELFIECARELAKSLFEPQTASTRCRKV